MRLTIKIRQNKSATLLNKRVKSLANFCLAKNDHPKKTLETWKDEYHVNLSGT